MDEWQGASVIEWAAFNVHMFRFGAFDPQKPGQTNQNGFSSG
jgi:hypothetical protein